MISIGHKKLATANDRLDLGRTIDLLGPSDYNSREDDTKKFTGRKCCNGQPVNHRDSASVLVCEEEESGDLHGLANGNPYGVCDNCIKVFEVLDGCKGEYRKNDGTSLD